MAKKKVAVKKSLTAKTGSNPSLSAMTGPIGPGIPQAMSVPHTPLPTAMSVQRGPDLIGANIGKSQQIDAVEQAQMVDNLRKKALKKKIQGDVSLGPTEAQAYTAKPVPGGLNEPVDSVTKKKVSVKKKKA